MNYIKKEETHFTKQKSIHYSLQYEFIMKPICQSITYSFCGQINEA